MTQTPIYGLKDLSKKLKNSIRILIEGVKAGKIKIKLYAGLVCPRRSVDYKKLEKYFISNGCDIVSDPSMATHIVVVTCGFIERNIQESLKIIDAVKKTNAKIIVGGCLPDIDMNRLSEHTTADIITTREMDRIDKLFPEFKIKLKEIPDANHLHDYHEIDTICGKRDDYIEECFYDIVSFEYNIKTFVIRIADGCNSRCSYCSHRDAIGPFKSKDPETCISEFQLGLDQGYRVFRITAMDSGHYGIDIKTNLPSLLKQFLLINNDVQFILEDINPVWVLKYAEEIYGLCKTGRIRTIHSPIQSGSPTILKKMRRYSDSEKIKETFSRLKSAYSDLHFATEILVGFPGETDGDFDSTLNFLREADFNYTYFYPYFENQCVESKDIYPKCSLEIIEKRLKKAIEFCAQHKISYCVCGVPKNTEVAI